MAKKTALEKNFPLIHPFTINFMPRVDNCKNQQFEAGDLVMMVQEEENEHISHCYLGVLKALQKVDNLLENKKYIEVCMLSNLDIRAADMFGNKYTVSYKNTPLCFDKMPQLPSYDFLMKLYERVPKIMSGPAFNIKKVDGFLMPSGRFMKYEKVAHM